MPLDRLTEPNWVHWFGTDNFGRDTLSRSIHWGAHGVDHRWRARSSCPLVGGTFIGTVSAYFPRVGMVLMRVVDVLMAFPALLLALALMTILDRGVINTIIAVRHHLYDDHGPHPLRHDAQGEVRGSMSTRRFVLALATRASCCAISLPNLLSPLLVQASFIFAFAQLQTAALDFLGLGLPPEVPSWGNMLSESRLYVTRAPWLLIFPGLLIILSVFSMNLVGDSLRDRIDPRFRDDIAGV